MTTIVRASSLPAWPDCPRRWAARHLVTDLMVAGYTLRPTATSIGAPIGTAVHAGAAYLLQTKMEHGEIVSADTPHAAEVAQAELTCRASEAEIEFDRDGTTRHMADAQKQVRRMVRAFAVGVAPAISPVSVEGRLEAAVPGTSLAITGQSDSIDEVGGILAEDERGAVRDLKCGKRLWWCNPQLGAYGLLQGAHGRRLDRAWIDWVPRVKADKEQPPAQSMDYDIAACMALAWNTLHDIERALGRWRIGDKSSGLPAQHPDAFMVNPSSMMCADRWCPAHSTEFCPHGKTK